MSVTQCNGSCAHVCLTDVPALNGLPVVELHQRLGKGKGKVFSSDSVFVVCGTEQHSGWLLIR